MSKSKKPPEQEEDIAEKEKPTGAPNGGEEPAKAPPAEEKPEVAVIFLDTSDC